MWEKILKALVRGFVKFVFKIEVLGKENLIADGKTIVAVNHRSNWDPVIMYGVTDRKLWFIAKSELFKNKLFGNFLKTVGAFPVERGKGDIGAIKTSLKLLSGEQALLIFPEGTRVRTGDTQKAKTGAVMIASHAKAPIVPVYISGKFRFRAKITVAFGKPIEMFEGAEEKLSREQLQEKADFVMQKIRELKV